MLAIVLLSAGVSVIVGVVMCSFSGLLFFYLGLKNLRASRVAARIPETPIRSIAPGMVHIFGRVEGDEPLTSPVTGVPCYYFAASSEKLGGRDWNSLQNADERRKFYVNDGTSRVLVDPQSADFDVTTTLKAQIGKEVGNSCKIDPSLGLPEPTQAQLRAILQADWRKPRVPIPSEGLPSVEAEEKAKRKWWMPESIEVGELFSIELGEAKGYRITENCLVAGHECSVIGTCHQDPSITSGQDANVIRRGTTEKTFVISCKRGRQLVRKLRLQGVLFMALGPALIVGGVMIWHFST